MLNDYSGNKEFEDILYSKTSGIPSVVTEYVRYFSKVTPFKDDGSVKEEFIRGDLLPSSVHAAFSKLIEKIADDIAKLPIMLVIAYRKSVAEETLSPLLSVLRGIKDDGKVYRFCDMDPFTTSEVHELCVRMLNDYSGNKEFEDILYSKTSGIPSVVTEYVRYFSKV
ncbi:MAG: hypothetical protein ACKO2H_04355, partial [Bacteroidota bacterium]